MSKLARPSVEEVPKYINMWTPKELEDDKKLEKLFKTYPENVNEEHVLKKVSELNQSTYKTQIARSLGMKQKEAEPMVAQYIVDLKIDQRLKKLDITLVNDIARGDGSFKKRLYSFATKYCSFHNPEFSIYDSKVVEVLKYCKEHYRFDFKNLEELKDYPKFHTIIREFQDFYGLKEFSVKEIDMYLWRAGKELSKKTMKN